MELNNADKVVVIAVTDSDQRLMTCLLERAGYDASFYANAHDSLAASTEHTAMIVCHRLCPSTPVPILPDRLGGRRVVVFSDTQSEHAIVHALEQGAHHYFDIAESPVILAVRLAAALRQHSLQTRRVFDVAPFKFNLERRSVYKDDKLINLSPKEYEFAYYLFAHRHRIVVNAELMTSVWSLPSTMDARRIDTAACRVRKKMQIGDASSGWNLRRIRRVGYELVWRGDDQEHKPLQGAGLHVNIPVGKEANAAEHTDAVIRPEPVVAQEQESA